MYIGTFINSMPDGQLWALLNVFWWASKIYPTTGRILFYLLCRITSEHYVQIKNEIDSLTNTFPASDCYKSQFPATSNRLKRLTYQHALVYECVELLNISFGHFLLFDITYIFISEINSTMYLLSEMFSESSDWLSISIIAIWNIYALINFSILCFSSHRTGNEVSLKSIDVHLLLPE